jgi:hypothetical protein
MEQSEMRIVPFKKYENFTHMISDMDEDEFVIFVNHSRRLAFEEIMSRQGFHEWKISEGKEADVMFEMFAQIDTSVIFYKESDIGSETE